MNNFKGKLQEHCQSKGLNLPEYDTLRLPSPSHAPYFQSSVIVQGKTYTGGISNSKKSSESLAAEKALKKIEKVVKESKIIYTGQPIAILVDLENQQKIVDEVLEVINLDKSNIKVFVYVTENSPLSDRDWKHSKIVNRVIPSVRADAADTFLIFEGGQLSRTGEFKKFVVVSQDHFAKTLEECFQLHNLEALMTSKLSKLMDFIGK